MNEYEYEYDEIITYSQSICDILFNNNRKIYNQEKNKDDRDIQVYCSEISSVTTHIQMC